MKIPRRRLIYILLGCGLLCAGVFFGVRRLFPDPMDLIYDEAPGEGAKSRSEDLSSDIRLMWKTVPGGKFPVSPVSAINAARRVFNTVDLTGRTREEVIELLGHNTKSNDSGYNFPFWPAGKDTVVYRFDCGSFGWQFVLHVGPDDRVIRVEKLWIE